ncbi:MAG: outer membrane beta-barrel protein, partial [Bacteroidales bacterium]|nr:outer membrane beta-barrel protein [Bacteroidales bacterium]
MKANFLIIFLLSGFLLNAQEFYGGITAGMTATQVAGDVCSGYDKAGLYAGVYANLKVSKKSVFQLEIDYIQKGSRRLPKKKNNYAPLYKLNLQYIDVPVLYKYIISKRFTVEIGPVYSLFIKYYEYPPDAAGKPFNTHNLSVVVGMYYYIT